MWRLTGELGERATACLWKGDSCGTRHRSYRNALTLQVVAWATVLVQYAATHCMRRQQPCTCSASAWMPTLEDVAYVDAERTAPCLLGRRCRYLEETGCVSVCINSCKLPTQVAGTPHHLEPCPSFVQVCKCVQAAAWSVMSSSQSPSTSASCARACASTLRHFASPCLCKALHFPPAALSAVSSGLPACMQEFFREDMGLPLTMTPNYDDFSCQVRAKEIVDGIRMTAFMWHAAEGGLLMPV